MKKITYEIVLPTKHIQVLAETDEALLKVTKRMQEIKKTGDTNLFKQTREEQVRLQETSKNLRKEISKQTKEFNKQKKSLPKTSIVSLGKEVNKLATSYREMSDAERKSARGIALKKKIDGMAKSIRKADVVTGGFRGGIAKLTGVLSKFGVVLGAAGVALALRKLVREGKEAVKLFAEFGRKMSLLEAVSGATEKQLADLENEARELGGTTEFTAAQVADLEVAFARLGFTPSEILDATAASLDAATVSQEELGKTAQVVGSTIRAFNLDARDSGRVSDVMASAFASSALTLEKFATAMAIVAPVADNASASLEITTALLGKVIDRGVDASTAGTAFRNIFLDLAKDGITFAEAMEQINSATDKNAVALDLFGKRSSTVASIIAASSDEVNEFAKVLLTSEGFAKRAADRIRGDLQGSFEKFRSASEALSLNLTQRYAPAVQGVTDLFITQIETLNKRLTIPISGRLQEEQLQLNILVNELTDANTKEERRKELIGEINDNYPKFLANINLETASTEDLRIKLQEVNQQYIARILANQALEELERQKDKATKALTKSIENEVIIERAAAEAQVLLNDTSLEYTEILKGLNKQATFNVSAKSGIATATNREAELLDILGTKQGKQILLNQKLAKTTSDVAHQQLIVDQTLLRLIDKYPDMEDELRVILSSQEEVITSTEELTGAQRKNIITANDLLKLTLKFNLVDAELAEHLLKVNGLLNGGGAGDGDGQISLFDQLRAKQKALREEVIKLTIRGEDYISVLEEWKAVTKELDDITKLFKKDVDEVLEGAAGSVAALSEELKDLKESLTLTNDADTVLTLVTQIAVAERDLARILKVIEDAKLSLQAGGGIFGFLDAELVSGLPALIFQALEAETNTLIIKEQEILKARLSIFDGTERQKQKIIKDSLEKQSDIEAAGLLEVANARVLQYKEGTPEYLLAVKERNDLEIKLEQDKQKRIQEGEEEGWKRIVQISAQFAQITNDTVFTILQQNLDREFREREDAIEEAFERRLEAAEGNKELTERLRDELDINKEILEKEQFARNQKLSIIEALINTALGITQAFTLPPPANFITAGIVAAQGAAQLAIIKSQKFASGGFTGFGYGAPDETGKRPVGIVHEKEFVGSEAQVNRYPELFNWLEHDRKSYLGSYAEGGFATPIPQVLDPIAFQQRSGGLSGEQMSVWIASMASAVHEAALSGTMEGSKVGSALGADARDREIERKLNLETAQSQ